MDCTVCILCYGADGAHAALARRCLASVVDDADWSAVRAVRVGLNAAGDETRGVVRAVLGALPVPSLVFDCPSNPGKYPLMRRMLYGPPAPVGTARVVWFDDDSHVTARPRRAWWGRALAACPDGAVAGQVWYLRDELRPGQVEAIRRQPWNDPALPYTRKYRVRFATGGFWVADAAFLRRWDYPFPDLHHNGGDSMLGELCRHRGRLVPFSHGVRVNDAKRRGMTTPWVWEAGAAGPPASFDVAVTAHGPPPPPAPARDRLGLSPPPPVFRLGGAP